MRISDWSSDVCSSDLPWRGDREAQGGDAGDGGERELGHAGTLFGVERARTDRDDALRPELEEEDDEEQGQHLREADIDEDLAESHEQPDKSEEHTSELQSLMRTSYAVFCLKKKNKTTPSNK